MKNLFIFASISIVCLSAQVLFAQPPVPDILSIGVLNGKAILLPAPEYPEKAKEDNIKGAVTVEVLIGHDGNVETAKAISGHSDLREPARAASLRAKFQPVLLNNTPVKIKGFIIYNFGTKPMESPVEKGKAQSTPVLNGLASSLPEPEYPAAAKAVCAQGTVLIEVEVDKKGNVMSAESVSGHPLLRASSIKAAKDAKFKSNPAAKEATTGILVYQFQLDRNCGFDSN